MPEHNRTKLTFSQAEGLECLPQPLQLGQLSPELRSFLWAVVHGSLDDTAEWGTYKKNIGGAWEGILKSWHVSRKYLPIDEFSYDFGTQVESLKQLVFRGEYNDVFDFIQHVLRHPSVPKDFYEAIESVLEKARAAYTVIDEGPTIVPVASKEERDAVNQAFTDLAATGLEGARKHLRLSAEALTGGAYSDSVRESIHAVESVARRLDPRAAKTLGPALTALSDSANTHGALNKGFTAIYGYTNDEGGIRHALLEGEASVDMHEALFMIGACAAFITYLIGKARASGLIDE